MSMPSSPPALPDEVFHDPPSSPPLPPAVFPSRKRHLGYEYESSLSSDPIFSEDASEESEVTGTKRKRYVRGPWFQHSPAMSRLRGDASKSSPAKGDDSGVWMGSDSSSDSIMGSDRRMQSLSFNEYLHKRTPVKSRQSQSQSQGGQTRSAQDTAQELAAKIVFDAVECCKESIDLTDMCLGRLDNETLRPLHQLIRVPVNINDNQKITDHHFAPMTPEIKLFLSTNELDRLPPELWNLGNLKVLSLRNNCLSELSPSIGRLRNLLELNVAGNQLRHLPWELLLLVKSQQLRLSLTPNPFVQPLAKPTPPMLARVRVPSSGKECLRQLRSLRSRFPLATCTEPSHEALLDRLYATRLLNTSRGDDSAVTYVASSKTSFFDMDGSPMRSPMRSFSMPPSPDYSVSFHPPSLPSTARSAAPSLFELSARACARSPYVHQIPSLLPDYPSPPVTNTVAKILESKEVGMQHCSVCSKQFLIPRAQWVEYWYVASGSEMSSSSDMFLPFLRKTCSWTCVDRLATERQQFHDACELEISSSS